MDLQKSFGMELQKSENNLFGLTGYKKPSGLLGFIDTIASISGLIKQLDLLRYEFIGVNLWFTILFYIGFILWQKVL